MANCINCEDKYSDKRAELGYATCLTCGEQDAVTLIRERQEAKLRELAPYVTSSLDNPEKYFSQSPRAK
jgi:hypothetical protein